MGTGKPYSCCPVELCTCQTLLSVLALRCILGTHQRLGWNALQRSDNKEQKIADIIYKSMQIHFNSTTNVKMVLALVPIKHFYSTLSWIKINVAIPNLPKVKR